MSTESRQTRLDIAKVEVLETMREVIARADAARAAIVDDTGLAWVWRDPDIERPGHEPDRVYAAWAIAETDYISDQMSTQDTLCAPGVIAVSAQTRKAIDELNAAKETFRATCKQLKEIKIEIDGREERLVSHWLRTHGFGRINRRQVYRQIHVLEDHPHKIGFCWVAPIRTEKLNFEQAWRYIQTHTGDDERIEGYLNTLVDSQEQFFAIVKQPRRPQPRANIWFEEPDSKAEKTKPARPSSRPKLKPAAAPLVIANDRDPPRIKPLPDQRQWPDRSRLWQTIEPTALIPELSLHCYQPGKASPPTKKA